MPSSRRQFLGSLALAMILPEHIFAATAPATTPVDKIMTVAGAIDAPALGMTLAHEHLLVDFIGADRASPDRYDRDEVARVVLPHLKQAADLGCRTLVECTPAYLGRDPLLLTRLSVASGVQLITNTGYYGAGPDFKYLPAHARTETADQLADRWTREFERGIGDSSVRPGFIKIGVNNAPLHELHRKLVQAAARTHLRTGLTIAAHTGNGTAALEQLDILRQEGVSPAAFIWVHAQSERDAALHQRVFEQGAWLSLDGVGPGSIAHHVELVRAATERGFGSQVLLSHDAGWYRPGEPAGGQFRSFDTLFDRLLPALRDAGITETQIRQLTVENPAAALTLRVRR